jgi:hypothetical protein
MEGDVDMMNALLAAALCSIVLTCAPAAKAVYIYARRDPKSRRRRHY